LGDERGVILDAFSRASEGFGGRLQGTSLIYRRDGIAREEEPGHRRKNFGKIRFFWRAETFIFEAVHGLILASGGLRSGSLPTIFHPHFFRTATPVFCPSFSPPFRRFWSKSAFFGHFGPVFGALSEKYIFRGIGRRIEAAKTAKSRAFIDLARRVLTAVFAQFA